MGVRRTHLASPTQIQATYPPALDPWTFERHAHASNNRRATFDKRVTARPQDIGMTPAGHQQATIISRPPDKARTKPQEMPKPTTTGKLEA